MFIVKLLRWLKGYVSFTAAGAFVERFLNLITRAGIGIWSIKKDKDELTAYTVARDYKKLRKYAKKADVKLRVGKRYGLPFYSLKYRKRAGLVIGAVAFLTFIIVMSQFIWSINVVGNNDVSQFEIEKALENEGVKIGTYKKDIDIAMTEQKIMLKLSKLSWIAINISGTTATVEVRERTPEPEMKSVDVPCNIVAAKSGQIIKMDVYDGEALVKKDESVNQGDIIVSGIIEDKFGNNTLKHAGALVIAQIQETKTFSVPLVTEITKYTGRERTKRLLSFLNTQIPIWFCGSTNFDSKMETSTNQLSFFGAKLPIFYKEERFREITKEKVTVTNEQAKKAALVLLNKYEKEEFKDAEIVSRSISAAPTAGVYKMKVTLIVNANIAKEQQILT